MERALQTTANTPGLGIVISTKVWTRDFEQFDTQNILPCEVVFGSPKMDCRGTGICKLTGYTGSVETVYKGCRKNPGFLIPFKDGEGLALVFRRELLCSRVLRTHFRKEALALKDDFPLPQNLMDKLGLHTKVLKAGTYRLESFGGHYFIRFPNAPAPSFRSNPTTQS